MGISDAIGRLPYLLGDLPRWPASVYPNRPALVSDVVTSYAQLEAEVDELTADLAACGARRGQRWGVSLGNNSSFFRCFFALLRCGVVVAPLGKTNLFSVIRRSVEDSCLDAVLIPRGSCRDYTSIVPRFESRDFEILWLGNGPSGTASPHPPRLVDVDPALILQTSGSTGQPRSVVFQHHAVLANLWSNIAGLGYVDDDTTLVVLPLHHAYGLVHQALCHLAIGATVILPPTPLLPPRLCHDIKRCGATTIATVPPIARFLADGLAASGAKLPRLRLVTVGAARSDARVLAALRQLLPHARIAVTYGLTEAGPRVSTHLLADEEPVPHCVGRPLPNVAVEIAGGADVGEITVRSRSLMAAFASDDAASASRALPTGDVGAIRAGELHLLGRGDRTINRGGITVAAAVIEQTLREHPAVASAVADSRADTVWGEVPVATVAVERPVSEAELLHFCAVRLPREECPVSIAIATDVPVECTKEPRLLWQFAGDRE